MALLRWQQAPLIDQIRRLRYLLPPVLVVVVVFYQLIVAQTLAESYGHIVHYSVEVAFYSLTGPVITWLTLVWVERNLREKDRLERQLEAYRKEREAILEEERSRIARDLHDGIAQTLYFLALKADMAGQFIDHNKEKVRAELKEIGRNARQIIREVRRTIFALRPLDWVERDFLPALENFITGFAEQVGWQITLDIENGLVSVPSRLEPAVFRLVQESLNNVAKHAHATQVRVTLRLVNNGRDLQLMIHDNGSGFDPGSLNDHGFGLKQMENRVTAVGGTFKVLSQPGEGTQLTSQLPLLEGKVG